MLIERTPHGDAPKIIAAGMTDNQIAECFSEAYDAALAGLRVHTAENVRDANQWAQAMATVALLKFLGIVPPVAA
jgi:hypothetical protein